jgi:hypothetical protein
MTTLELATWVGSIGTFFILGSLILLWRQNSTLQQSVRSYTYQSLQHNEAAYHGLLINHPEIDQIIYKEDTNENLADIKAYWTALLLLTFMENVCVQRKDFGLIPDELWGTWVAYMCHDFQRYSFLQKVFNENKQMFAYIEEFMPSREVT